MGASFGTFGSGAVYASFGDGFVAGRTVRERGTRGSGLAVTGSCPAGVDPAAVLAPLIP
ncbi:MAG: hypothetical protein H6734_14880 [Alphaproteobacteria bacterium]|nr:hypothetical protein [Alphaproteobacteria bacterium]